MRDLLLSEKPDGYTVFRHGPVVKNQRPDGVTELFVHVAANNGNVGKWAFFQGSIAYGKDDQPIVPPVTHASNEDTPLTNVQKVVFIPVTGHATNEQEVATTLSRLTRISQLSLGKPVSVLEPL